MKKLIFTCSGLILNKAATAQIKIAVKAPVNIEYGKCRDNNFEIAFPGFISFINFLLYPVPGILDKELIKAPNYNSGL